MLEPGGWLAVYDVWFPGEMVDVPAFATWLSDVVAPRYPRIPRNVGNVGMLTGIGFELTHHEDSRAPVDLTLDGLADYLMTHSERLVAVRVGGETEVEQREFLANSLGPFFERAEKRSLVFGIELDLFRAR